MPMSRNVTKIAAILVGLSPIVFVSTVGVAFLQPTPPETSDWIVLTPWESLPDDGLPIRLVVSAPHRDSWMRLPDQAVGAVYARRLPGTHEVRVLSAVHGKFGVQVEYDPASGGFRSQCFVVRFDADGNVLTDDTVKESQYEDLEAFPVQVADGNVLVKRPVR
jgi:hypothetical protein